jgi:hypothetical protein
MSSITVLHGKSRQCVLPLPVLAPSFFIALCTPATVSFKIVYYTPKVTAAVQARQVATLSLDATSLFAALVYQGHVVRFSP